MIGKENAGGERDTEGSFDGATKSEHTFGLEDQRSKKVGDIVFLAGDDVNDAVADLGPDLAIAGSWGWGGRGIDRALFCASEEIAISGREV